MESTEKPHIKLTLSTFDKIIEFLGWILLSGSWFFTFYHFSALPAIIPIHYDVAGEADGFGSRNYIFTLPAISTILFIGLSILNNRPHLLNYPTEITTKNAPRLYQLASKMLRLLKLVLVIIFSIILIETIEYTKGHNKGLGIWFLPIMIVLISSPIIYYLIKSSKFSETK